MVWSQGRRVLAHWRACDDCLFLIGQVDLRYFDMFFAAHGYVNAATILNVHKIHYAHAHSTRT